MLGEIFAWLDWVKIKAGLPRKYQKTFFNEGEIWWCSIGRNVGVEMYGKGKKFTRPVLIFKKFSDRSFFGLPLSTRLDGGEWYVPVSDLYTGESVVLNQGRTLDSRRLSEKIITLEPKHIERIAALFGELMSIKCITPPAEAG